jgi:hypothetical protein
MVNIKNDFGLGFQNNKCLVHLCCLNDTCDKFVQSNAQN